MKDLLYNARQHQEQQRKKRGKEEHPWNWFQIPFSPRSSPDEPLSAKHLNPLYIVILKHTSVLVPLTLFAVVHGGERESESEGAREQL